MISNVMSDAFSACEQDVDVPESTSDVQMCIQHELMRAGFQLGVHVPYRHKM